ncbi:hypothetical protein B0J13DRAFT_678175 [Dactylonectria estremocensis]|uniref:Rhodopsin domain-containing protein n=1 Tax=Dactylonectria estremocensis TaxID=1079267 RepID=A0A9P9EAR2_9HYPO|nr:hypothetical protein B0J13DRAFT_678175 [Dactylonectria estremocensis]
MSPLRHGIDPRAAESSAAPLITGPFPPLTEQGTRLIVACAIMMFFTTAWTVMRIISQNMRKNRYHVEDYFYFIGQIIYYGFIVSVILFVVVGGAGHSVSQLGPDVTHRFSRIMIACQMTFGTSLAFIKIAVIGMIRRIFRTGGRLFIAATWVATVLCFGWGLYAFILPFTICTPAESASAAGAPQKCLDGFKAYVALAVLDIISEVAIVLLPMKLVYDLQMNRAHKLALLGVFGAGFVTIIFSCVRLYYLYNTDITNITKSVATSFVSTVLQGGIAVMVASSPMLRPVFDRIARQWLGITLRSTQEESSARVRSRTTGGGTGRMNLGPSHIRSARFQQMHESEEHLAWEMGAVDAKSTEQITTVHVMEKPNCVFNPPSSQPRGGDRDIYVTRETIVEGRRA